MLRVQILAYMSVLISRLGTVSPALVVANAGAGNADLVNRANKRSRVFNDVFSERLLSCQVLLDSCR